MCGHRFPTQNSAPAWHKLRFHKLQPDGHESSRNISQNEQPCCFDWFEQGRRYRNQFDAPRNISVLKRQAVRFAHKSCDRLRNLSADFIQFLLPEPHIEKPKLRVGQELG